MDSFAGIERVHAYLRGLDKSCLSLTGFVRAFQDVVTDTMAYCLSV